MAFPVLIAGGFSLLMVSAGDLAANKVATFEAEEAGRSVELAQTHAVGEAGVLPSKEMAAQFKAYLAWTKAHGLSRLVAFQRPGEDRSHLSPNLSSEWQFPNAEMAEQFHSYLQWTQSEGLNPFYVFRSVDFD